MLASAPSKELAEKGQVLESSKDLVKEPFVLDLILKKI